MHVTSNGKYTYQTCLFLVVHGRGSKKEVAKEALDGACLSGFPDSSSFVACRNEGLCGCSWLKVVLLLQPSVEGGVGGAEVQREHNKVRGSWVTGNNEGKASFTSLV